MNNSISTKTNKLVSIVIPMYNVEEFIGRCLDSVINQTYHNLEIIIINDGSTDKSNDIALNYSIKDNRIKCYTKANGGLSSARNFGLNYVTGDYLIFLDSDDFLSLNAIEVLINNLWDNDILCFDYVVEKNNISQNYHPKYYNDENLCTNYVLTQPSACTKIYRSKFFIDNFKFDVGIHYEDLALIPSLSTKTDKIGFVNECLYHYYIRDNSIMHKKVFSSSVDDKFIALNNLYDRMEGLYNEEYNFIVIKQLCIVYITEIINFEKDIYKPRIMEIKNFLKEKNIKIYRNKYFKQERFLNKLFIFMVLNNMVFFIKLVLKKSINRNEV